MFEQIEVDGFRSLVDFKLSLDRGLNVLVGANGTGKSNFIAFLDFLATMVEEGVNAALGVAQGAASVFSKEKFNDDEAALTFKVRGSWSREDSDKVFVSAPNEKDVQGEYTYACELKYLRSVPAVFIACESICLAGTEKLIVERKTKREQKRFETTVRIIEASQTVREELMRWYRPEGTPVSSDVLPISDRLPPERSMLIYLAGDTYGLAYASMDISSYRSVNIDPAIARKPTPVSSTARLSPTGEGLAGALYQLKRGASIAEYKRFMRARDKSHGNEIFESIMSWCREVNPSIVDVNVDLDFGEALFKPSVRFLHGKVQELYPLSRVSDGTVKWLALVTMVLANPDYNIVEEPENFLHPLMQELFVQLCRSALEREPFRTLIFSTHSPTLLDCCQPRELTLFEVVDGQTRASKVSNREELDAKIDGSRFGLGHYYRIGAIYGKNSSSS